MNCSYSIALVHFYTIKNLSVRVTTQKFWFLDIRKIAQLVPHHQYKYTKYMHLTMQSLAKLSDKLGVLADPCACPNSTLYSTEAT